MSDIIPAHEYDRALAEIIDPRQLQVQAQFIDGATIDAKATAARGYRVYRIAPFIRVRIGGQADTACHPARPEDVKQFPREWQAYQNRRAPETDIASLPGMDEATARTIRELGLFSVERLAEAPVVESIEQAPEPSADPDDEFAEAKPPGPPCVLPVELERWQTVAGHFLKLRDFALTGQKPRVKLTANGADHGRTN